MKPYGPGHSLLTALTVAVLVVPYAQPLVCDLASGVLEATHHQAAAGGPSSSSSDDIGSCHGSMICNTATPGLVSIPARAIATRTDVVHQETRSPAFLSANIQPPLTPPPRA